jgi:hypothetical protein
MNLQLGMTLRELIDAGPIPLDTILDHAYVTEVSVNNNVQEKLKTFRADDRYGKEHYCASTEVNITLSITKLFGPEFYPEISL